MPYWRALFGEPIRVKIPIEFSNKKELLTYLGLNEKELRKIWYFRRKMYHHFSIAKKAKKVRVISAPNERLKFLQAKLAIKLTRLYRVRNPVHGFVPQKSIKTNAESHLQKRYIVNLDLKDFFFSITENRVEGLLLSLGIDQDVSRIIARVCCNNGHLPQGAPTSPIISNMICFKLDKRLMDFSKQARCIYTRYADDLTFSAHHSLSDLFEASLPTNGHFSPGLLSPKLTTIFQQNGFQINPRKAHYADPHSRKTVTGLKVNQIINVDRKYVRNVRAAFYSIEKLGIQAAEEKYRKYHGGNEQRRLANYLRGKISFLNHIKGPTDPVARNLTEKFNVHFPTQKIEVVPTQADIWERSVWILEDRNSTNQGTAFFLHDFGLITAAHCIPERNINLFIYQATKPANKFNVSIQEICRDRDLAILEPQIPETEFFKLRASTQLYKQGDLVGAFGYPDFGPGDRLSQRQGNISSKPVKSGVQKIEVSQQLAQGMSGGPIINQNSEVIGVIHKGGPGESRNLAISISELSKLKKTDT